MNKYAISQALQSWLTDNQFSAAEFGKNFGIPTSYLSQIVNGKFEMPNESDQPTPIADKYFIAIAEAIDFNIVPQSVDWKFQPTPQALMTLSVLEDAKRHGYTNIIIGATGSGKTYITDAFVKRDPKFSFKITVGSTDSITNLLDKVLEELRLPIVNSKSKKISSIIAKFTEMRRAGGSPILIFDESEYMKQPTLANIKEFHDHLNGKAGVVLNGTDQLLTKIERLKKKNAPGIPQFYRRVKFGIRQIPAIDTRFQVFLQGIQDKGLVKFLQNICENYGELHDALLPAMREAERRNEPLSENLVRTILNIPI